ncbi:DUF2637 domain-containing protein [Dactylosporangium sp. NPDC005572]|uniref:DUF2637 domain-containing protein n=1 Tax=Dactylosporangium sp. NPDC005572 TaxID=3156889 RepID=UPI0033A84919
MVHVALRYGERPEVAYVLPISVDGMLIVASAAMVEDKRNGNRVRWSARIAFRRRCSGQRGSEHRRRPTHHRCANRRGLASRGDAPRGRDALPRQTSGRLHEDSIPGRR